MTLPLLLLTALAAWANPVTRSACEHDSPYRLTAAEEHKSRIVVGGDSDYPPYEFLDRNSQPAGYNVDLTRAIARRMGLNVVFRLRPWSQIREGLERNEIDIVQGIFYSPERDEAFDFSPPHVTVGHVIVSRKDLSAPDSLTLEDLAGKTIVVMRGDITHDAALAQGYEQKLVPVASQEEALRLVEMGVHDYALAARIPAFYWINRHGWKNLHVGSESIISPEYCYGVVQGRSRLLAQFTEGLQAIRQTGEYREIQSDWLGVYDSDISFWDVAQWILLIVAPILLLVALLILWTRALKRQVSHTTRELREEIAERRKTEASLRETEEIFRQFMEHSPIYVFFKDDSIRSLRLSRNYETMLGRPLEELLGKTMDELFPSPLSKSMIADDRRTLREGKPISVDEELNGRFYTTIKFPIIIDGQARYLAGYTIDVTGRKLAEQERERLLEQMNRAQRLDSLAVLAGGIAHDFNNLLGGIFGYIDMAEEHSFDPRVKKYLARTMISIDRARALTHQLLTFAKGGAPTRVTEYLFPFVEEAAQFSLSGSPVSCRFEVQPDLWPCSIDRSQIAQVIDNLFINARQAMPGGGTVELTARNITIAAREHATLPPGRYVKLSISDHGIGIPVELLPRIFDPFFSTKEHGHGLGLATCYSIITRHKGTINAESVQGSGTTFHVYLPASSEQAVYPFPAESLNHRGKGSFLVMDDEVVVRELLDDLLSSFGYTVVTHSSGRDAVTYFARERLANRPLTAMILDLTIPGGMGGKKAIREIRKLDREVPVFVASGYADDPVMAHPYDFGFTASIRKPFLRSELAAMLERHLGAGG